MSDRIETALQQIEQNPKIPATQKELAKRAGCSRGTLWNRKWPINRLKEIKRRRRQEGEGKPKKVTIEHRASVDLHIEDKKKLLQQLNDSRSEIAVWIDKCKELENENKKLARANAILLKAKSALETRVSELQRLIAGLESRLNDEQAKRVVVPLKRSSPSDKKPQKEGRKKKSNK